MPFPPLICRWPNGDISLVAADSRAEADDILDEVQNPDRAELLPLNHPIAIHFSLKRVVPGDTVADALELDDSGFNEALLDSISERAYPVLSEVLAKPRCTQKMIDDALDQERAPIGEKRSELSVHPGAALVQSKIEMPRSVAEALAGSTDDEEEEDEEPSDESDLDELYQQLQAEPNPYFKMRTACKLILVSSAQHRITHIGQRFGNPEGDVPAIVTSFVSCPDQFATDLRALLDRTIQQFFQNNGLESE